MRLLNILVIGALILAASFVYKIKFDSTLQAERVAKLRGELRRERNAIAVLRAEWARLDTPGRIQGLADRHLALQPIRSTQFDSLDRLPERPRADRSGTLATIRSAPCSRLPPIRPAVCCRLGRGNRNARTAEATPENPLAARSAFAALRPRC